MYLTNTNTNTNYLLYKFLKIKIKLQITAKSELSVTLLLILVYQIRLLSVNLKIISITRNLNQRAMYLNEYVSMEGDGTGCSMGEVVQVSLKTRRHRS